PSSRGVTRAGPYLLNRSAAVGGEPACEWHPSLLHRGPSPFASHAPKRDPTSVRPACTEPPRGRHGDGRPGGPRRNPRVGACCVVGIAACEPVADARNIAFLRAQPKQPKPSVRIPDAHSVRNPHGRATRNTFGASPSRLLRCS